MKIGIDIDDTIIDTSDYLTKYVAQYFGLTEDYLIKNCIYYINLPKNLKVREKEFESEILGKQLLNIPIKPFAKNVINKLKSNGNQIIIITARDTSTYKYPIESTMRQLEYLGINYDKLICTRNKRKACIDNQIDVFIDDSMSNIKQVIDIVDYCYLFTSPYNKTFDVSYNRVNNWNQLYDLINYIQKKSKKE